MLKSLLVDTWAVVVARTGLSAKTRLTSVLPRGEDRAQLARAMLADVLAACSEAGLRGSLVVTDTAAGWSTAWNWGARPLLDLFLIDTVDAELAEQVAATGARPVVADALMRHRRGEARLGRLVLARAM